MVAISNATLGLSAHHFDFYGRSIAKEPKIWKDGFRSRDPWLGFFVDRGIKSLA